MGTFEMAKAQTRKDVAQLRRFVRGLEWSAREFVVVGVLVFLCGGCVVGIAVAPKYPDDRTKPVTASASSEWCKQHAKDQWSGRMDDTTRRYLRECLTK